MKITKIKEDITSEIANSLKNSIAIDTEATGLQIPERDKLSLIQICDGDGNVFIIQPNKNNFKAPNLVSVLENEKKEETIQQNLVEEKKQKTRQKIRQLLLQFRV